MPALNDLRRKYIFFNVFFGFLIWVPVFYEFHKLVGLSDNQIFQIQSWYYLAFCLLELPTGHISDRFGHHVSIIIGSVFLLISNLTPLFSQTFIAMTFHWICLAGARSLTSGATSAYLYDSLQSRGELKQYKEIEGSARSYGLFLRIIGWAIVGFLMKLKLELPYIITSIFSLLAVITAINLAPVKKTKKAESFFKSLGVITSEIKNNTNILIYIIIGLGMFVMVRVCQVNLFQPLLKDKSFDLIYFGLIMSVMTIFESLGAKNSHKIKDYSDRTILIFCTILVGLSFAIIVPFSQIITVLGFCLFSFFAGVAFPVQKKLMNDQVTEPETRASILSLESLIDRLITSAVVYIMGPWVELGNIKEVLITVGIICTFIVVGINTIFARKLKSK